MTFLDINCRNSLEALVDGRETAPLQDECLKYILSMKHDLTALDPDDADLIIPALILLTDLPFTEDEQTAILAFIVDPARLFPAISKKMDLFSTGPVFEKMAPYIEHFYTESREILISCALKDARAVAEFIADLAVVSYPFADELFNEVRDKYRASRNNNSTDTDCFDDAWNEVLKIRQDRILLFPEVID